MDGKKLTAQNLKVIYNWASFVEGFTIIVIISVSP